MEALGRYATPIGIVTITALSYAVTGITLGDKPGTERKSELTDRAAEQLIEYFDKKRTSFDLPVFPDGTPFQMKVWKALQSIPYGEVRTYAQIAEAIGKPGAVRAVGNACGANPIPIVIPCHRVVAKDGIGGFSAGKHPEKLKELLLKLEEEK